MAFKSVKWQGMSRSRLGTIWRAMMSRCYKDNDISFHRYGGRGITICDEWKDNPLSFIEWANSNGYADNLSIDRTDTNGNYHPDNCRWTDPSTQAYNKRVQSNNTTGVAGIWNNCGSWGARITVNKERIYLGTFKDINDAIKARIAAEYKYFGESKSDT